jgi:menaquinone-dependent protoporphyrinogen oxidase
VSKNFLVVYVTKSGSTTEVAQAIGDTLTKARAQVTVKSAESVGDIEAYDAVLIGSPIINGKCMKGVKKFVSTHCSSLSHKTVAYFITCMRLSQMVGESMPNVPIFVDPAFGNPKHKSEMNFTEKSHPVSMYLKAILGMSKNIKPVSVAFFRGVLDYSTIGFVMTLLFKLMAKVDGLEPGDYRNWEAIRSWTEQIYSGF